jgi:hypothetical protein
MVFLKRKGMETSSSIKTTKIIPIILKNFFIYIRVIGV